MTPKMLDNWTTDKMRKERTVTAIFKANEMLDALEEPDFGAFICDNCGQSFLPEEGCYIGPKDREDDRCCPVTALVGGGWENLCLTCNTTK